MSLIEVLAAVLLVSFGILGLLSLLGKSTQATVSGDDNQRAAMLASEMASILWVNNSPPTSPGALTLPAGYLAAWQVRVGDPTKAGLPTGVGTVTFAGQSAHVLIQWTPVGDAKLNSASGTQRQYMTDVVIP